MFPMCLCAQTFLPEWTPSKRRTWSWSRRTRSWVSTSRTWCQHPVSSRPPTQRANESKKNWIWNSLEGWWSAWRLLMYGQASSTSLSVNMGTCVLNVWARCHLSKVRTRSSFWNVAAEPESFLHKVVMKCYLSFTKVTTTTFYQPWWKRSKRWNQIEGLLLDLLWLQWSKCQMWKIGLQKSTFWAPQANWCR